MPSSGPTRVHRAGLFAALLGAAAVSSALAGELRGAVGMASDKVIRGLSQGSGRPALLLDLNYRTDGNWLTSLGIAALHPSSSHTATEFSLGLARAWQLNDDWLAQAGYAHYQYEGQAPAGIRHYEELNASMGWRGRVSASFALSPDTYSWYRSGEPRPGAVGVGELAINQRLLGRLALQGGLGYYQLLNAGNWGYGYSSVGLSWGRGHVQGYLSYIRSQAARRGLVPASVAGERCVGTLLWGF